MATDVPKRRQAELAWPSGDRPEGCGFGSPVSEPKAQRLLAAVPVDLLPMAERAQARITALGQGQGDCGRYRLESPSAHLFLRVTARLGYPLEEHALIEHLASAGVPVNRLVVCGQSTEGGADETVRIDIRPFLEHARHYQGTLAELQALGETLRDTHKALANYPGAAPVRDRAQKRFRALTKLSARFAAWSGSVAEVAHDLEPYRDWIEHNRSWIQRVARDLSVDRLMRAADAQCLHGEPHQANVLFDQGQAVLIDFEEALHLYASPRWDLAFAVQRFVLVDDPDPAVRNTRLRWLSEGYGDDVLDPMAMREVAWTTLMIVFDTWRRDRICAPQRECDKFRRLEEQARAIAT